MYTYIALGENLAVYMQYCMLFSIYTPSAVYCIPVCLWVVVKT